MSRSSEKKVCRRFRGEGKEEDMAEAKNKTGQGQRLDTHTLGSLFILCLIGSLLILTVSFLPSYGLVFLFFRSSSAFVILMICSLGPGVRLG
jgi:hypothetical protein